MKAETIAVRAEDIARLIHDVQVIKNAVLDEGEPTEWAKKELKAARKVPDEELISMEEVEDMILRK